MDAGKWRFSNCVLRNPKTWPIHLKVAKDGEETEEAGSPPEQRHVDLVPCWARSMVVGLKVFSSFFGLCVLFLCFKTTANMHLFLSLLSITFFM